MTDEELAAALGIIIVPQATMSGLDKVITNFLAVAEPRIKAGVLNGQPMKLRILIESEPEFGAFASTVGDTDVIVLTAGTAVLLGPICRALASHRALLPTWNSKGVAGRLPMVCDGPLDKIFRFENCFNLPRAGALEDPRREDVATYLWHFSLYYLLGHEFQHIYAGHCQFPTSTRLGPALREIAGTTNSLPDGFEDEALEWDADAVALDTTLALILKPLKGEVGGRQTWRIPADSEFGDLHDALTFALAPGVIVATILGALNPSDVHSEAPDSHPHPLIRLQQTLYFAPHLLSYRTGKPIEEWDRVVRPAISAITGIIQTVFPGFALPPGVTMVDVNTAADRRLKIFESTWARIRPELDKLKRGGHLAPATPCRHPAFPENEIKG